MTAELLITNATLIDGTGVDPVERAWLFIEGGRVRRVGKEPAPAHPGVAVHDAQGRTVMPGLIDAHAHLAATTPEPWDLDPVEHVLATVKECERTLADGFTTVRDAAGLSPSYATATEVGSILGPRLFVSDASISQTGGHGDTRVPNHLGPPPRDAGAWRHSIVADGTDEVRRATREVLRRGAHQVKIMAGGGCISPADPIQGTQLTTEEIAAAVQEATARGTYVMAHVYLPESIRRCLDAGVRSIEHGNLLDEETAHHMAAAGAFLVPTLATYERLATEGRSTGYADHMIDKIDQVRAGSFESLRLAAEAGVRIASGSDLLGGHQRYKAMELELKASVLGPMGAIVATTATNGQLLGREDLGRLVPGSMADLIVVDGSPLDDITVLQQQSRIHAVLRSGRICVDRLPEHRFDSLTQGDH